MRLHPTSDLVSLAAYLHQFLALVGEERWFKRADQLLSEMTKSPFLWKIVADYHWLEMELSHQAEIVATLGRLDPDHFDLTSLTVLQFASAVSEVHSKLSPRGRKTLEGRLRDSLKAETGFAALYLEIELAQRISAAGYDVQFPDMEGSGQYDLLFSRGEYSAEVECKTISADAGRRIHRKDFYRFMETLSPALADHVNSPRRHVIVITLADRLSPSHTFQRELSGAVIGLLRDDATSVLIRPSFRIERYDYDSCLRGAPMEDRRSYYEACTAVFGEKCHVAGGISQTGGCLIVMRSEKEDDTSKPLLVSLRKAASQLSKQRPSFIAVQFDDIAPADLVLPHLRRRMGLLSYALFLEYGALHVNATHFCGFGSVVAHVGRVGTPAFGVVNPTAKFAIDPADAEPFLATISDAEFATVLGAPLPAQDISNIPI